ncbi:hypothetical protein HPB52_014145 [Rhipicephalus sanguineus]|uniref:Uncharacterized protein n=1 Tax=Rhipicephalus sanguineus TaxID=34632 RepID=A0A9D4PCG2_RHISA|nr:hypothetical protein HPB52_014145 [Rhipicephalus sanguineus]
MVHNSHAQSKLHRRRTGHTLPPSRDASEERPSEAARAMLARAAREADFAQWLLTIATGHALRYSRRALCSLHPVQAAPPQAPLPRTPCLSRVPVTPQAPLTCQPPAASWSRRHASEIAAAAALLVDQTIVGTVLYRPSAPGGTFSGSSRLILAQALSARPGVAAIRVNHKRNIVAADATTRECLEQLLNIKELKGIPVTAKEPADHKSSVCALVLLGCLLHEAIKRACEDLQASHDGAVCQQRQEEAEHKELRFQYGDQEKVLAQHWTNLTNFPVLSADLAVAAAPSSSCKEMWADVVRRSASATMTAMTPEVTEADAAHGYPPLPITAGTSTRASTGTVDVQVKRCPVHATAFVGGVWIHRKVTKTGRAAVPLPTAAFELGPASDSGPPDARGMTSKVSPRSEGEALRKGGNAAYPRACSPCGEGHAEEREAGSAKLSHSHICTGGGNLSVTVNGVVNEIAREKPRLKPDAVPTVFEDYPTHLVPKQAAKCTVRNICDQEVAPKQQKRNVELADPELYNGETKVHWKNNSVRISNGHTVLQNQSVTAK